MNQKIITIETQHTQTTQNKKLTQKETMNIEILKRIMSAKKPRLENSQDRN